MARHDVLAVETFVQARERGLTRRLLAAGAASSVGFGTFFGVIAPFAGGVPALALVIAAPLALALAARFVLVRGLRRGWTERAERVYRVQPRTGEPCGACGQTADSNMMCARCDRALCLEHVPASDARCPHCEHAFVVRVASGYGRYVAAVLAALPMVLYGLAAPTIATFPLGARGMRGFSTGVPLIDAFAMAIVFSVVLAGGLLQARRTWIRQRFLAQTTEDRPRDAAALLERFE